ncbi:DUF397 domain-containing protein [Streptomyces sp. NPDC001678]|uniref:DUF397 domain-containing protein n=1 Tax=Streptomyces sp. NPDC001678 TaxID=3364599 RepID=UPI0036D18E49
MSWTGWQKSTFSGTGPDNDCLEVASVRAWRKSSFSGAGLNNECLEVAAVSDAFALRESDEPGTVIATGPASFAALIRTVKAPRA